MEKLFNPIVYHMCEQRGCVRALIFGFTARKEASPKRPKTQTVEMTLPHSCQYGMKTGAFASPELVHEVLASLSPGPPRNREVKA
jgi:hypothetical protein